MTHLCRDLAEQLENSQRVHVLDSLTQPCLQLWHRLGRAFEALLEFLGFLACLLGPELLVNDPEGTGLLDDTVR